jgi:hypothetical protein
MSLSMFMDPAAIGAVGAASLVLKQAAFAFIPITSVALSLRLYVRITIVKGFGLDDVFLIIAQVSLSHALTLYLY